MGDFEYLSININFFKLQKVKDAKGLFACLLVFRK
jgi:hypothetical protein